MSIIINEFTQYELTVPETLQGQILSQAQLQVIQNLRAQYAVDKINLKVIPNDYQSYVQAEASLQGALMILGHIIDCHNEALAIVMSTQAQENPAEIESQPYMSVNSDTSKIFTQQ